DDTISEALAFSEKEGQVLQTIFLTRQQEMTANIDEYSQSIIISQSELLLSHPHRFSKRQLITPKHCSHQVLEKLEELLNTYFDDLNEDYKGLPSVQLVAAHLHMSPTYLSGLLKSLTGLSTQQHIHLKIIDKAKERLSTTELSISEIAYELGF